MTTDPVLIIATGATITAEIEGFIDPLTLPEQYMTDPREKVKLHVTSSTDAAQLSVGQLVRFSFNGAPITCEILMGYASAASLQNEFLCIEHTSLDA